MIHREISHLQRVPAVYTKSGPESAKKKGGGPNETDSSTYDLSFKFTTESRLEQLFAKSAPQDSNKLNNKQKPSHMLIKTGFFCIRGVRSVYVYVCVCLSS